MKHLSMDNLPVVIFAGGLGTRMQEETATKPKPMVTVGGIPIIYWIICSYAKHGAKNSLY